MIQYFPVVTGSLTVLGNINVSGSITTSGSITISGSITSASFASTASYWSGSIVNAESASFASTASFVANAQTASYVLNAVSSSFATSASYWSGSIVNAESASFASTASFVALAQSASYVLNAVSSSFASTASFVALAQSASNAVSAVTASFANNLTVAGTLTAQTLVVQTITSSVDFVTGSTRFGSILGNTHVFTGSVLTTGSITVSGKVYSTTTGLNSDFNSGGIISYSSGSTLKYTQMGYDQSGNYGWIQALEQGTAYRNLTLNAAGGNVGIGTTSPSSLLSLYAASTSADVDYIKMEMPSWGGSINYKKNIIWHDSGNIVGGIGMAFTSPYTYMDFHSFYNSAHTTGSLMRIQGNGNVGIGTTTPYNKLEVNGTIRSTTQGDPTSGVGMELFYRTSDTSSYLQSYDRTNSAWKDVRVYGNTLYFGTQGNNNLTITSAGNVGIGTTSTNTNVKLKIKATSEGTSIGLSSSTLCIARIATDTQLNIGYYSTPDAFVISSTYGSDGAYKPLVLATSDTERLRIESGGKVLAPYGYQSFKGSITLTAQTTGTVYTMAADGLYTVYVRFYGASGIFMASSIVTSLYTNGESFISSIKTASNVGISVSGNSIQVGNGGYGTYTFQWSILFQPVDF